MKMVERKSGARLSLRSINVIKVAPFSRSEILRSAGALRSFSGAVFMIKDWTLNEGKVRTTYVHKEF